MSSPTYLLQTRSVIYHIIYPCVSLKSCQCQRTNPFSYIESFPCYWSHNLHSSTVLNTAKSNAPNAFPNSRVLLACYCATHKGPTGSHRHECPGTQTEPRKGPSVTRPVLPRNCLQRLLCAHRCVLPGRGSSDSQILNSRCASQKRIRTIPTQPDERIHIDFLT